VEEKPLKRNLSTRNLLNFLIIGVRTNDLCLSAAEIALESMFECLMMGDKSERQQKVFALNYCASAFVTEGASLPAMFTIWQKVAARSADIGRRSPRAGQSSGPPASR